MNLENAKTALKKYFGYDHFRPMQADIIQSVYENKDSLVLMPTGGGKSICYQIPALTLPGTAVVVSPLISLMQDQVKGLQANGVKAAFLNSSLDLSESRLVEDDFFNNNIDLLYVSPEKLLSSSFLPLLQATKINLFAIDEAHCISAWGHDFRKEYTQMKMIKKQFPGIPILALTATADKITRNDIQKQLNLDNPGLFIASFDRPNLSLEVRPGQRRFDQIRQFIQKRPNQSGIIYTLSRKNAEKLAQKLQDFGINAAFYHAGMNSEERSLVQDNFIKDECPIICATIAFGMGIDKSNVRWVIHYNLPKNIEGYYQEIGRAGRDGVKADTLLFYSYADVMTLRDILGKQESEQTNLQLSKLDRMQQYAESLACRRRLLLSYFGEEIGENCGNCDICQNPPSSFDGTIIAQKAFSAIHRLRERVGMNTLIDVLRGSGKKEIFEKGYNQIKTYGAGRDIPNSDWQHFIIQLINLGYLEIAHDQFNVLKLRPASKKVLFEGEKVALVQMTTIKERQKAEKAKAAAKPKRERVRDELFEVLRKLRLQLAQEKGIPPYVVFSDKTLEEMAARRPINDQEMQQISGVGERKLHLYGSIFIDAILAYIGKKGNGKADIDTLMITLELYKQHPDIKLIAQKRDLTDSTIYGHLEKLVLANNTIDLAPILSQEEIQKVTKASKYVQQPMKLKDIFDYLEGQVPYGKIRLALAVIQKGNA